MLRLFQRDMLLYVASSTYPYLGTFFPTDGDVAGNDQILRALWVDFSGRAPPPPAAATGEMPNQAAKAIAAGQGRMCRANSGSSGRCCPQSVLCDVVEGLSTERDRR
jgi:hypothetical protein